MAKPATKAMTKAKATSYNTNTQATLATTTVWSPTLPIHLLYSSTVIGTSACRLVLMLLLVWVLLVRLVMIAMVVLILLLVLIVLQLLPDVSVSLQWLSVSLALGRSESIT
jgi:hypothetical protein